MTHLKNNIKIQIYGKDILLLPEKAAYLPEANTLFIADVHLGKAGSFQQDGLAVPAEVSSHDLDLISKLIKLYHPKNIIYLGDLFHSRYNSEWDKLAMWRKKYPDIRMMLVLGNHDRLKPEDYAHADLEVQREPFEYEGMLLCHHPDLTAFEVNRLVLCGHIHPGIRMTGPGRSRENLPCFWLHKNRLMLPSFGRFTGLGHITPEPDDRVFAIAGESLIEV